MKIKITLLFISFFIVQFITAQEINYKIKIEYLTTIEWQIPQTYTSEMYVSESLSCFFFKKATKGGFIPDYESNTFEVNIASRFPNYHLKTESNFLSLEQVFSKHFGNGGTFDTFNADKMKAYYKDMLEEGKEAVNKMKDKYGNFGKKKEAAEKELKAAKKIKKLQKMLKKKLITQKEYNKMKSKILKKLLAD